MHVAPAELLGDAAPEVLRRHDPDHLAGDCLASGGFIGGVRGSGGTGAGADKHGYDGDTPGEGAGAAGYGRSHHTVSSVLGEHRHNAR
ncbi:hypothetical protein ACWGLG_10225 [Streptomyces antimycoticus]|nr:hypothetical protein [Streptomyces antimycoticus]